MWKNYIFNIQYFLFVVDDVKTNNFELSFQVFRYKYFCFCKKLYFGYCNLFI